MKRPSCLLDSSSSSSETDCSGSDEHESESEPELQPETVVPPIKRQKLSLPRTQVCIVSQYTMTYGYDGYDIAVADLDSLRKSNNASAACNDDDDDDEFIPIRCALRLKVSNKNPDAGFFTFCGLGSKLYIFESSPHKSGYAIDLSSYYGYSNDLTKPTIVLKKRALRTNNRIRDMIHPKTKPFAIPTPDSKKILLFSRDFYVSDFPSPDLPEGANDFELYDPKTDTWKQLPGILHDWSWCWGTGDGVIRIKTFTFIGASTFFIQTNGKLMFALDLESIDQGWQRMGAFYGAASTRPMSRDRFLLVDQHLCVNPRVAYDVHKQQAARGFTFPLQHFGDGFQDFSAPLLTLLGEEAAAAANNNYYFCTLLMGICTTTQFPHMILNVTSCDLSRYKRNKDGSDHDYEELSKCMTVGVPVKFFLDGQQIPSFNPVCFFSIQA